MTTINHKTYGRGEIVKQTSIDNWLVRFISCGEKVVPEHELEAIVFDINGREMAVGDLVLYSASNYKFGPMGQGKITQIKRAKSRDFTHTFVNKIQVENDGKKITHEYPENCLVIDTPLINENA